MKTDYFHHFFLIFPLSISIKLNELRLAPLIFRALLGMIT